MKQAIKWYETCKWKCRVDASACNNKQRQNNAQCKCDCKELIDKRICDKELIWKRSNCECDKLCDVGEHLDYKNCKCIKKDQLINWLKNVVKILIKNEMIHNGYKNIYSSCTVCIVLFAISFSIVIGISNVFIYFYWHLKKSNSNITNINPGTETITY